MDRGTRWQTPELVRLLRRPIPQAADSPSFGAGWGFPPRSSRRVVRSYLEDPVERRRYALRLAATIAVLLLMMLVLVWALGQLGHAWGSFLDLFRHSEPSTGTLGGAIFLLPIG